MKWCPVTLTSFREQLDMIAAVQDGRRHIVFNLCDGDEVNGTPGISVIDYLEAKGLAIPAPNGISTLSPPPRSR
jgi:D-alanine-D-alanine ligase